MTRFEELKTAIPKGFRRLIGIDHLIPAGAMSFFSNNGLSVLVSEEVHGDKLTYLHVSFSRRSRCPSYEDLDWVRKAFIGEERESIQAFPPKAEYVNFHPYTLHLWHCYERRIFPEVQA